MTAYTELVRVFNAARDQHTDAYARRVQFRSTRRTEDGILEEVAGVRFDVLFDAEPAWLETDGFVVEPPGDVAAGAFRILRIVRPTAPLRASDPQPRHVSLEVEAR